MLPGRSVGHVSNVPNEARGLQLGEGADPSLVADVRALVQADPAVERAADRRSVRDKHPDVKYIYLSAEGLAGGRRAPESDGRPTGASTPAHSAHGGRGA